MGKKIDMTGKVFGKLTVVKQKGLNKNKSAVWECLCECGNTAYVITAHLNNGNNKSCGCIKKDNAAKINKSHGMTETPEYNIWCDMKKRCFNKKSKSFKNYGGRGITVCDEWKNDFMAFYRDMGNRPSKKHKIDRIDNDGNYNAANCRWVTHRENCENRSTSKRWIINGEEYCSARSAAKSIGVSQSTIMHWCYGYKKGNEIIPKKDGCFSVPLYQE